VFYAHPIDFVLMIFILHEDKIDKTSKPESGFNLSFVHFNIAYPLQVL